MKFCDNCGEKLEENSLFCEACGTRVDGNDEGTAETTPVTPKPERKPLSKTQKTIGIGVVAAAVLLFGGYKLGESVFSEENQTERIVESLVSKDAKELAKVVNSTDPNFKVSVESMESFATYLEQNPNYLNQLVNGLEDYGAYESFYIRQEGKKLGLYEAYELVLTPVYATVRTNAEGTVLTRNGEEIATATSDEFTQELGPFAPGIHNFSAVGEINGNELTTEREVEWIDSYNYYEVDLSLHGEYIYVESDLSGASVYLNDEEVGTIEDYSFEYGPFKWEEGMVVHVGKSFENDEIVSEKYDVVQGNDYYSFTGLSIADEYELSSALNNMYNLLSNLSRYFDEDSQEEFNQSFSTDSAAYENQRVSLAALAESVYEDEEASNLYFDVSLNDFEQVGTNMFDVSYEVTYTTSYNWSSDKNDKMQHYSKEATILFEPTNNPYRDYDVLFTEIRNEELLYEE